MNEVKVEPEDFHDFSKNASKENEVTPNSSESLKCFNKCSEDNIGEFQKFYFKVLLKAYIRQYKLFYLKSFLINNNVCVFVYFKKKIE